MSVLYTITSEPCLDRTRVLTRKLPFSLLFLFPLHDRCVRCSSPASPPREQAPTVKKYLNIPTPPPQKPSSTAAEKELNWFDVLGGSNPIKEYRKMQHQREVQAWYLGGGQGAGPTVGENARGVESSGSVVREGAPFHAPPPIAGSARVEGSTPVVGSGRPVPAKQSKPQVELRSVRPKPAGNSRSKGKATARRPGKMRGKA